MPAGVGGRTKVQMLSVGLSRGAAAGNTGVLGSVDIHFSHSMVETSETKAM